MTDTSQSTDNLIQEALHHGRETIKSLCEQYTGQASCTASQIDGAIVNDNQARLNGPGGTLEQLCKEAAKGIPMPTVLTEAGLDPKTPMNCPAAPARSMSK